MGYEALDVVTTGERNVALGNHAGGSVTTGYRNTYIGMNAGDTTTTGYNNICIGNDSDVSANDNHHEGVFGRGGIGKGNHTFYASAGNAYHGGNTTTWSTTSDRRIKKNITNFNDGLSIINQIQVRNFEYKTEDEIKTDDPELTNVVKSAVVNKTGTQIGLIAQEAEAVSSRLAKTTSNGIYTLETDDLFWYMLNAIKELSAEVTALKAK